MNVRGIDDMNGAVNMSDATTPQLGEAKAIKRVCQIIIAFQADTDEEAMAVKRKVDEAMYEFSDAQVTFTSRNFRGTLPMMQR